MDIKIYWHNIQILLAQGSYTFCVFLYLISNYEALTLVRHETQYDTGHNDTTFLEKLGHDTVGDTTIN